MFHVCCAHIDTLSQLMTIYMSHTLAISTPFILASGSRACQTRSSEHQSCADGEFAQLTITASVLGALGSSNARRLAIRNSHLDQPRQSSMGSGSNVEGDVSLSTVLGRSGLDGRPWLKAMTMRLGVS